MEAYEPNYTPTKRAVYIGIDFHKHYSVFCITDDVEQAKTRVGKAIELDAKFKLLALDDADLEPLWESFKF
jgi:hypothetical protein